MKEQCPLCGSLHQKLLETLKVSDIIRLYKKKLGEDFSYLFNEKHIDYYECLDCSLLHFSPIVTGDENLYGCLQKKFSWYYADDKEEYGMAEQFLSDLIKTDISVLEIGAGKGVFRSYLKQSDRYVGLEFSQEAVRLAKENNVTLYPEMIEEHSIKYPNSYDVVCSFQVLEHVANTRSFIESCLQALKHNGILIIAVPSEDDIVKTHVNNLFNMPPHHITRFSDKALENIAQLYNLELLAIKHDSVSSKQLEAEAYNRFQQHFLKHKLIDLSLKRTLVKIFCKVFVKIVRIRNKEIKKGSTVVAFYKKTK